MSCPWFAVYNKPYRATKAEESIAGKTIDVASAQAAGTGAKALTLNKWKIQVAAGMLKKVILACAKFFWHKLCNKPIDIAYLSIAVD